MLPNSRIVPSSVNESQRHAVTPSSPSTDSRPTEISMKAATSRQPFTHQSLPSSPQPTVSNSSPSSLAFHKRSPSVQPVYASRARRATFVETSRERDIIASDSSTSSKSKSGFGRLFKKWGQTNHDVLQDNAPQIRPLSPERRIASRTPQSIPLAPPPPKSPTLSEHPSDDAYLEDLPESYLARPRLLADNPTQLRRTVPSVTRRQLPSLTNTIPDTSSTQKRLSVYSTFGSDGSDTAQNPSSSTTQPSRTDTDATQLTTATSSMQHPSKISSNTDVNKDMGTPRNVGTDTNTNMDNGTTKQAAAQQDDPAHTARLSKRLSGGSAGTFIANIIHDVPRRRSRPPPDDIAKAMLQWKRQSVGASKRLSGIVSEQWHASLDTALQSDDNHLSADKQASHDLAVATETDERQTAQSETPALSNTPDAEPTKSDVPDTWLDADVSGALVSDPPPLALENVVHKQASKIAQQLWDEDYTLVPVDTMATWLGQSTPLHADTLSLYMAHFDFSNMPLDHAFRTLCSKLYLKAEAQQIDRILEVFARRYWDCNPDAIFKSADVAYAVVYSMLLLNTDLHVAQGLHQRMTRQAFVSNTLAVIHDQHVVLEDPSVFSKEWEASMEDYLKALYTSVKQNQILQPVSRTKHQEGNPDQQPPVFRQRVNSIRRNVGSILRRTNRNSVVLSSEPRGRPSSIHGMPLSTSPSMSSPSRTSFSSGRSTVSLSHTHPSTHASSHQHSHSASHRSDNDHADRGTGWSTYRSEGVVLRKHLFMRSSQRAKHREWRGCFLVAADGELKMYALPNDTTSDLRRPFLWGNRTSLVALADAIQKGKHVPFEQDISTWRLLDTIRLNHTLAKALDPPGYNRHRPFVFSFQLADGGTYLFQVASMEQLTHWTTVCNYWAARESKAPLLGAVSNKEYGWGASLQDTTIVPATSKKQHRRSIAIDEWQPPTPPVTPLPLGERDEVAQFKALQRHLTSLDKEMKRHRELKPKLLGKFPSSSAAHTKVIANWEAKAEYLMNDIFKYKIYCDVLEKSIQQQKLSQKPGVLSLDYHTTPLNLIKEIGDEMKLDFEVTDSNDSAS